MMQSSYDTTLSANNREELILVVVTNSNSSGVPPSSPLPTCQAIAFVFIVIFVTLIYAPNSKQPHLCGRKQVSQPNPTQPTHESNKKLWEENVKKKNRIFRSPICMPLIIVSI